MVRFHCMNVIQKLYFTLGKVNMLSVISCSNHITLMIIVFGCDRIWQRPLTLSLWKPTQWCLKYFQAEEQTQLSEIAF